MLLIGPSLLSGIGHHLKKYGALFPGSTYVELSDHLPDAEEAFIFALPVPRWLERIPLLKQKYPRLTCMTVCETDTVHEDYGKLFEHFGRVAVPSTFCQEVFSRQFPRTTFFVIHAHIPNDDRYVFYHIGNVTDPRKNVRAILEAFLRLNEPRARLLIKATCHTPIQINLPNVRVINGLLSDEELDDIHRMGDCYVSFSHSEGVGMGAVEAALRDKPVIITDYGGAPEYIKTPYTIACTIQELEKDDFLFKKGMRWGNPDPNQLLEHMRDAFDKRLRHMDHSHTKQLTGKDNILKEFLLNDVLRQESDETREHSA
jgi:glycosyltransferase involved in cell wall biosynthesis